MGAEAGGFSGSGLAAVGPAVGDVGPVGGFAEGGFATTPAISSAAISSEGLAPSFSMLQAEQVAAAAWSASEPLGGFEAPVMQEQSAVLPSSDKAVLFEVLRLATQLDMPELAQKVNHDFNPDSQQTNAEETAVPTLSLEQAGDVLEPTEQIMESEMTSGKEVQEKTTGQETSDQQPTEEPTENPENPTDEETTEEAEAEESEESLDEDQEPDEEEQEEEDEDDDEERRPVPEPKVASDIDRFRLNLVDTIAESQVTGSKAAAIFAANATKSPIVAQLNLEDDGGVIAIANELATTQTPDQVAFRGRRGVSEYSAVILATEGQDASEKAVTAVVGAGLRRNPFS